MQVLFFLGLIGIIFTTMTFINASVTVTAMQKKLDQLENVEKMFQDAEFAINKGILVTDADLSVAEANGELADLTFLSGRVKWNDDELLTDPWGTDYQVLSASERQTIYADTNGVGGANNRVNAYVTAFALISAGPDGRFGNRQAPVVAWPTTYNDIRAFTPANDAMGEDGEDDIFLTFTTFSSAMTMWNRVKDVHDKVKGLAVNHYTEQLELFQPQIQAYYSGLSAGDVFDANGNYILDDDQWMDDLDTPANTEFPRMTTDLVTLGASAEVARLPAGFLNFNLAIDALTAPHDEKIRISFSNPSAGVGNNWQVTYENEVEGATVGVTP